MKERLATLISGRGSTMQEVIKICQSSEIPMEIACVISSTPNAEGIERARRLGIPKKDILVANPDDFRENDGKVNQESFGLAILKELKRRYVTVVTQNGWMPLTPQIVIDTYSDRIFNQHPGPVPEFGGQGMYGRRVHAARLLFTRITKRDYWTEAIIQRVLPKYDEGVVVKSKVIEVLPEDTVATLQQRVLPAEHKIQIELLKDVCRGEVKEVKERETLVRPEEEQILLMVKKVARLLYPQG